VKVPLRERGAWAKGPRVAAICRSADDVFTYVLVMPPEMREGEVVRALTAASMAVRVEWTERVERRDVPMLPARALIVRDAEGPPRVVLVQDQWAISDAEHERQELLREPGVLEVIEASGVARLVGEVDVTPSPFEADSRD